MRYRVLGEVEIVDRGERLSLGGRRQRLVLAVLLAHVDERISIDRLIDDVWGQSPPATARKTLQAYISRLRSLLGESSIETISDGYRLEGSDELDAVRFEQLAVDAERVLDVQPDDAAALLHQALGLWRGAPWGSLGDEPALVPSRTRLLHRRLEVLEHRIEADLACGGGHGLVPELETLIGEHPDRERLHRLLMVALYLQGRQADALDVARRLRERLAADFGLEPSPAVEELQRRILAHDPDLRPTPRDTAPTPAGDGRRTRAGRDAAVAARDRSAAGRSADDGARGVDRDRAVAGGWRGGDGASTPNPYRGLRAFGEQDESWFFGRDSLVDTLLERVAADPLVVVVGPSGSGKSSVVRAGLLPAVRRHDPEWVVATMVPGRHPFAELHAAVDLAVDHPATTGAVTQVGDDLDVLRLVLHSVDEDGRLLLVVDQLEELFLLAPTDERDRFVACLVEAIDDPHGRLTVVATVRADFLDRPLQDSAMGGMVEEASVLVPPLTPAALEQACVRPAADVGVDVAPELVTALVADVAAEPGALPLFQYTLTELFESRRSGPLTLGAYRRLGGLTGALASRADELLASLGPADRDVARQVLLRLVTLGDGVDDTRRRVHRAELDELDAPDGAVGRVLDEFGRARLLTFDRDAVDGEPTVEVAHEALLRSWPTLRGWIDDARDDLRHHRALLTAEQEWRAADRNPDFLLAGARLETFEDWRAASAVRLTDPEGEFLASSRAREDERQHADDRRAAKERELERRASRRLRQLVAVFAVAAVAATGIGLVAVDRADQLALARDAARVDEQLARADELAASAIVNRVNREDPELGRLLALHAARIIDAAGQALPPDVVAAFHWALQGARVPYPDGLETRVLESPDGLRGIFVMDVPDLVGHTRAAVTRDLTAEECATYLDLDGCPDPLAADLGAGIRGTQPAAAADGDAPLEGTRVEVYGQLLIAGQPGSDELVDLVRERTGGVELVLNTERNSEVVMGDPFRLDDFDLISLPQPSFVNDDVARQLGLQDLSGWLDTEGIPPHLLEVGRVAPDGTWPASGGVLRSLPASLYLKGAVWHSQTAFAEAGYEPADTWDQLVDLADRMVADGRTPWCFGLDDDIVFRGWPATDVVELLVLGDVGPAGYDAWWRHEIPFDHDLVRRAVRRYTEVVIAPDHVAGGRRGVLETGAFGWVDRLRDDECMMAIGPPDARMFSFTDDPDMVWFPFPPVAPAGAATMFGGAAQTAAITDRPEVRAVMAALSDPDAILALNEAGIFRYSPSAALDTDAIEDPELRSASQRLVEALREDRFRHDASDLMPRPVWEAFNAGMVEITADPSSTDRVLAEIERVWVQHEREG